ncbi:MAG: DUF370 domain-containing protein [Clostridiales bacterium]|nr:DUF370 domain-containing protein [Clostridiales bacterium]
MYVDIGMDLAVRASHVLGVFDLDNTSWSKRTRKFLQRAQEDGCLIEATDELPKSFVLTQEYGQTRVYLTKFNASILARRFAGGRQQ